ncbi:MAG: hypothetical protein IPM42_09665 [Saprospiraceae bacterium]|nr:hypothetical protein [Saprospiraceae bacterium]
MNIQAFNKKLRKIAVLSESADENGRMSSLEKDLLLSYIRDLYDIAIDVNTDAVHHNDVKTAAPAKTHIPEPKPVALKTDPVVVYEEVRIPEPVQTFKPEIQITAPVKEVVDVKEDLAVMQEKPAPAVVKNLDPVLMAELFQEEKVSDLSEKLSLSPVKDLTKAMGINEKIFTIQELFGNNSSHFNEVAETLNKFSNFTDAKNYLLDSVIPQYNWTSEAKLKKASTFIKLVKRRYV